MVSFIGIPGRGLHQTGSSPARRAVFGIPDRRDKLGCHLAGITELDEGIGV
ncbi:MAG: hypothetical protein ACO4CT_15890 [Planctomycetota bacterium]|jgi:hypothetical protein